MTKSAKFFLLLLFGALFFSVNFNCSWAQKTVKFDPIPIKLSSVGYDFVNASNAAAIKILKYQAQTQPSDNVVFSPFSISIVLTMLMNGAEDTTLAQLREFLNTNASIDDLDKQLKKLISELLTIDRQVEMKIANSIWLNSRFVSQVNPDYLKKLQDLYAQLYIEPFTPTTVNLINQWVSENTNDLINQIIDQLNPDELMVLLNAIYFKGQWFDAFDSDYTHNRPFYLDSGDTVLVPTMSSNIKKVGIANNDSVTVGELYYGQGNFSFFIIMPSESIDTFLNNLTPDIWQQLVNSIWVQNEVDVQMPKFELTSQLPLVQVLTDLGLTTLFDPETCNLDKIAPNTYVSSASHKAYIKLDEEGTEAAAVTHVTIGLTSVYQPITKLIIDRPFIFAIRETTTNLILFAGIIRNPMP